MKTTPRQTTSKMRLFFQDGFLRKIGDGTILTPYLNIDGGKDPSNGAMILLYYWLEFSQNEVPTEEEVNHQPEIPNDQNPMDFEKLPMKYAKTRSGLEFGYYESKCERIPNSNISVMKCLNGCFWTMIPIPDR